MSPKCPIEGCKARCGYKGIRRGRKEWRRTCDKHGSPCRQRRYATRKQRRRPYLYRYKRRIETPIQPQPPWDRRHFVRQTIRHYPPRLPICVSCGKGFVPSRKDQVYCRHACVIRAYAKRHPDLMRAKRNRYRLANPEKYRATRRKRYDRNRESEIARKLAYYYLNHDECKATAKAYAAQHKDKSSEYGKIWRKENPERVRQLLRDYLKRNKPRLYAKLKAQRDTLSDSYVKLAIVAEGRYHHLRLRSSEIPPDILELKRNQLRLHRAIYNPRKEETPCTQEKSAA